MLSSSNKEWLDYMSQSIHYTDMPIRFHYATPNVKMACVAALKKKQPLVVMIDWGKYDGSVGKIDPKYLWVKDNGVPYNYNRNSYRNSYVDENGMRLAPFERLDRDRKRFDIYPESSLVIELEDGRKLRYDSKTNKVIRLLSPGAKLRTVEKPDVVNPEFVLDRHGQELKIDSSVLVSMTRDFVFGKVEKLTPDTITIKRGKIRTKLPNNKTTMRSMVLLNRGIADRFLLEKLSKI